MQFRMTFVSDDYQITDDNLFDFEYKQSLNGSEEYFVVGTVATSTIEYVSNIDLSSRLGTEFLLEWREDETDEYGQPAWTKICRFTLKEMVKLPTDDGLDNKYRYYATDNMDKLDVVVDDFLDNYDYSTPQLAHQFISDMLDSVVPTWNWNLQNVTYLLITERPTGRNLTARNMVEWFAQIVGATAVMEIDNSNRNYLNVQFRNYYNETKFFTPDDVVSFDVGNEIYSYNAVSMSRTVGGKVYSAKYGSDETKEFVVEYNPLLVDDTTATLEMPEIAQRYRITSLGHTESSGTIIKDGYYRPFTAKVFAARDVKIGHKLIIRVPDSTSQYGFKSYSVVYFDRVVNYSGCTFSASGNDKVLSNNTVSNSVSGTFQSLTDTKQDKFTNEKLSNAISRSTGATITSQQVEVKNGWVNVYLFITYSTSVSNGNNFFTGTIDTDYAPEKDAMGCSYYSGNGIICRIEPSGAITVRNIGSSVAISNGAHISLVYPLKEV